MNRRIELVVDGLSFPEGPRWHQNALYFSDFYTHRVLRLDQAGEVTTVAEVPGQPSGLGFAPDGSLVIASMVDRRLLRLSKGEIAEIADLHELAPHDINDLVVDSAGGIYVGNFGSDIESDLLKPTVLIRVDKNGMSVAAGDLIFPNGTVITPDGKTMLVAETFAHRITKYDIGADASLTNRREWARFHDQIPVDVASAIASRRIMPDGMALDLDGNLWVADAGGSGAVLVAAGGQILDTVRIDGLTVYAVALGGNDRRTLYMCAGPPMGSVSAAIVRLGRVFATRVQTGGCGLP